MKKLYIAFAVTSLFTGLSCMEQQVEQVEVDKVASVVCPIEVIETNSASSSASTDAVMQQDEQVTYKLLDGNRLEITNLVNGNVLVFEKGKDIKNPSWFVVGLDGKLGEQVESDLTAELDEQFQKLSREKFLCDICLAADRMNDRIARKRAIQAAIAGGSMIVVGTAVVSNPFAVGYVVGTVINPMVSVPAAVGAAGYVAHRAYPEQSAQVFQFGATQARSAGNFAMEQGENLKRRFNEVSGAVRDSRVTRNVVSAAHTAKDKLAELASKVRKPSTDQESK